MSLTTPIIQPLLPGSVIRFIGQEVPSIPPSAAETVALTIVHDWGPDDSESGGVLGLAGGPQLVTSFAAFTQLYGDSDTAGRTAVAGCFAGTGLPGSVGAGAILVDRMVATDGARATIGIHSTASGTPLALTLTAIFKGSRANKFGYIQDSDPSNSTRDRLRLTYQGTVVETYLYAQTDVITLTSQINTLSKMVTAVNAEGSPARLTAGTAALAGGVDGSDIVSADHLAALAILQTRRFGILACYDLTDGAILASYVSWVQTQDEVCRPVRFVIGGASGEAMSDAITRSAACDSWHVVNFGVGQYHDDLLDKDLSTSQLAPRFAGILAAAGQVGSLTFSEIAGLHAINQTNPDTDDLITAVTSGVSTLEFADSPDADLQITKGVTTWTTLTDADHPVEIFGDPRLVGIMDTFVRNMKQFGDRVIIGKLPVTDDTRNLVRGQARSMEDDLQTMGLILPENTNANPPIPAPWVICEDPNDPSLEDAIPYTFGWRFAKTTNNLLGQGTVQ